MSISTRARPAVPRADHPPAADARHRRFPWRPSRRRLRLLRRPGIGLVTAAATTALLLWHLGRPALWLDESASMIATQRTWPALWKLFQGTDAPLVPYYVVLKILTEAATALVPALGHHPEVLYRAPSVVAVVLAAWALTGWLARFTPAPLALGTGCMFLLTSGVSRYGQEARPYGILLLAAVLCSIVWTWTISHRRWWWVLLYAVTVAGLIAGSPLAGTLVVAHLVAATVLERGDRLTSALRTLAGAALGGLAALPIALTAVDNGGGATRFPETTYLALLHAFRNLFTLDPTPLFGIGYLLLFSLLGATRVFDRKYRFIARLALAWAAVPPLLLLPAVLSRPNLLIGRYLMFTVPGWTILAGLGLVTIMDAIRRVVPWVLERNEHWWPGWTLRRVPDSSPEVSDGRRWRRARAKQRLGKAAAAVAAGGLLICLGIAQEPSLRQIRTAGGHGADPRPAFAETMEPQWAGLPIIPGSRPLATQFGAYRRSQEGRLSGIVVQRDQAVIWPVFLPAGVRRELARRYPRAIVLLPTDGENPDCRLAQTPVTTWFAQHCMPRFLQQLDYRVQTVHTHGLGLTFAVVERPSPLRLRSYRDQHALSDRSGVPRRS